MSRRRPGRGMSAVSAPDLVAPVRDRANFVRGVLVEHVETAGARASGATRPCMPWHLSASLPRSPPTSAATSTTARRHPAAPVTSICSLRVLRLACPGLAPVAGRRCGRWRCHLTGGRERGRVPAAAWPRLSPVLVWPCPGTCIMLGPGECKAWSGRWALVREQRPGVWGNGLGAVLISSRWPAGLRRGAVIPGATRAREVDHVCVCAGHRLAIFPADLRSFVRI